MRERLGRVLKLHASVEQIIAPRQDRFRISPEQDLPVVHGDTREVFGEPFVEPALGRRIVQMQQKMRKRVRYGTPAAVRREIKHVVVAILPCEKKPGRRDWLAALQSRYARVLFIPFHCDDVQWHGHIDFGLRKKLRKNRAHLLEAQNYVAPVLLSCIRQYRKMGGTHPNPVWLCSESEVRLKAEQK